MKQQVIIIDKPIGKTPLEIVDRFKGENPQYKDSTISYAGRLDPMAHGLLLLLIDEENKNREKYLHLGKTYEVEILFGFETDTYDVLGKVSNVSKVPNVSKTKIEQELKIFIGKREQKYPAYSSKAVNGKPLFWWARNNRLAEIEIPKREVEIFSIAFLSSRKIVGNQLLTEVERKIQSLTGNFRQKEIIESWAKSIDECVNYQIIKIVVHCSSGTYMRTLAHELGKQLGNGAIASDIYRTRVGEYSISQNITEG